jgi:hypothetical protein
MFYNFVNVVDVKPCMYDLMEKFKRRKPKVVVEEN